MTQETREATTAPGRHVLVIGGGIAGLAAALRLRRRGGPQLRITVVEQSHRLGGKIDTGQLGGLAIEAGAETFLARRPEALDLAADVGLAERVRHPAAVPAGLLIDNDLRNLPRGTVMGIPAHPDSVADILTTAGLRRLESEPARSEPLLEPGQDIAVGQLVKRSFGPEIAQRLVDPLLGGVYAGRADDLSLDVTIPALAKAARSHNSLSAAAESCLPPTSSTGPVFGSIEGGLSRLVEAVATASGADVRLGLPVRELHRTPTGWRAVIGATRAPSELEADAVVIAVPSKSAARLLSAEAPSAAAQIRHLDYASVALVTLALADVDLPRRSGFLVPVTEGRTVKAATFFSRKWPHLAAEKVDVVRMSIGRYGEERVLQRDDTELIDLAHAELAGVLRTALPVPVEATVRRWGGGLPQYGPGHLDRIRLARAALEAHPIALAGAAFDGVGIPACIASGQAAADRLLAGPA